VNAGEETYGAVTAIEESIYDAADAVGAGATYKEAAAHRPSTDISTHKMGGIITPLPHDYALATDVDAVGGDVCYDTADSGGAAAMLWFAEPEYALGANPDGNDSMNSLRMKSVHRANPLHSGVSMCEEVKEKKGTSNVREFHERVGDNLSLPVL
jgi:hypothetical protein